MKKLWLTAVLACTMALGTETAHAQTVGLDEAIRNVAAEFAPNVERGASVAIIAIQADSVGMSNHLINGMIAAFFGMRGAHGFEVASRGQIELLMGEHELSMAGLIDDASAVSIGRLAGVQYILTGTFTPFGGEYRFWAQLIEVETGFFRGIHTADVRNDAIVSALLGAAGREPQRPTRREQREPRDPDRLRANWLSAEITILGGGIRYERDINRFFSVGGAAFVNVADIEFNMLQGVMTAARFFPGGFPFYLELGIGFGVMEWSDNPEDIWDTRFALGFMITPAIGVRLGGRTRGFFANPFVSFPIVSGAPFHFRGGIGLGFAW